MLCCRASGTQGRTACWSRIPARKAAIPLGGKAGQHRAHLRPQPGTRLTLECKKVKTGKSEKLETQGRKPFHLYTFTLLHFLRLGRKLFDLSRFGHFDFHFSGTHRSLKSTLASGTQPARIGAATFLGRKTSGEKKAANIMLAAFWTYHLSLVTRPCFTQTQSRTVPGGCACRR